MNVQSKPTAEIRHEGMRIAGQRVELDELIEVYNPYNNAVVGTVPAARAEHVRAAFAKAAAFKPKLTRYERQQILLRTAELLRDRKEDFARLITAESGLCWKDSLYEAGRAYDVYSFAGQLTILDDGEIYSCDISPQAKLRKIGFEPIGKDAAAFQEFFRGDVKKWTDFVKDRGLKETQ